jgi:hypothetical protein
LEIDKKIYPTIGVQASIQTVPPVQAQQKTGIVQSTPLQEEYTLIEDVTKYISKNYGQTYATNFDISVNSVSPHIQTANVAFYTVNNGIFNKFQDDVDIDLSKDMTVYSPDLNYRYVITLTEFGRVGLKSTAYFRVRSYKKNN